VNPLLSKSLKQETQPRKRLQRRLAWVLAAFLGLVFVLPHLVRIASLGSYAEYTPFTAHSHSAMVFDETFLYAAEANHMLTRGGAMAYDDTWEHRDAVYPYSVVPTAVEATLAAVVRSLKLAHMMLAFVCTALSGFLLMALFRKVGAEVWLAALLAMAVLVGAFSPMTLKLDVLAFLHHAQGARVADSLQAARMPNPAMTFLQFAAALLLLANCVRGDERPSHVLKWAAGAGLLGGLLFFSYIYYAITWSALLCLLAVASLLWRRWIPYTVWMPLGITGVLAVIFMAWKHVSIMQGNYELRAARIGLYHSHAWDPPSLEVTRFWGLQALACALVWLWLRRRRRAGSEVWHHADALMPVLLAAMVSGLVGLNMQVITGFNLQQAQHYPHMILQPVGCMMIGVLVALMVPQGRIWRIAAATGFVLALGLSAMAQIEAGRDTAEAHRLTAAEQTLFAWLNANTSVGSVVATNDLALSIVLPVQTHNSVLFADGSRSSAMDDELMERFLLASRLVGSPPAIVATKLEGEAPASEDVRAADYSLYLFEFSEKYQRIRAERRVAPDRIDGVVRWYTSMDVPQELERFRVDYVWMKGDGVPAAVVGWRFVQVLQTKEGRLWHLIREPIS
jgi:hypothetical protein